MSITVEKLAERSGISSTWLTVFLKKIDVNYDENSKLEQENIRKILSVIADKKVVSTEDNNKNPVITVTRRSTTNLSQTDGHGISTGKKTVNVQVRRKRSYVQREKDFDSQFKELLQESCKHILAEYAEAVVETKQAVTDSVENKDQTTKASEGDKGKLDSSNKETKDNLNVGNNIASEVKASSSEEAVEKQTTKKGRLTEKEKRMEEKERRFNEELKRKKKIKSKEPLVIQHNFAKPTAPVVHNVKIPETIVVSELAKRMSVKASELIKSLMKMGMMATINQMIDQDTAALVVEEMGHTPILQQKDEVEDSLLTSNEKEKVNLEARCPVVTIMGHVDHGKTSLLDYIREANVIQGEAGGITQHIGAYSVTTANGRITFLDTPGHAAFTAMRARGASCTDLIVLVVAADDGVMPQTKEAIQHARAAKVPMVVAVNKIDKPEANPEKIRNELASFDVIPEDWGGDVQFVDISAKQGTGVDNLLDAILLQAEVLELQASQQGAASGVVIESRLDRGRGAISSLLVQAGTLKQGDIILAGMEYGRIRAMHNERGESLKEAGPSTPVEILGLSGTPGAGDQFIIVPNERKAREVALFRQGKYRDVKLAKQQAAKLEDVFANIKEDETSTLAIVLKADVQGSCEAIIESLKKLATDEVGVDIVASGVGAINESDIHLASASKAVLLGFNVRADAVAKKLAAKEDIEIRYYSIIYELLDQVKDAMSGLLSPEEKETILGLAEVRDVFRSSKLGAIAGCMVIEGTIHRKKPIRVLRDNVVIYEGELESLRRFKDDVNEVRNGMECGIGVKNYNDIKEGDQIEVYEKQMHSRKLS